MTVETQAHARPLPKFRIQVEIGDIGLMAFQDVSGLEPDIKGIALRAGPSEGALAARVSPRARPRTVTLSRGACAHDPRFQDWFAQTETNTPAPRSTTIRLLDETGIPVLVWTLTNARPGRLSAQPPEPGGTTVAVETMELAHEGFTIENGFT